MVWGSCSVVLSLSTFSSSMFSFINVQQLMFRYAFGKITVQFLGCCDTMCVCVQIDSADCIRLTVK